MDYVDKLPPSHWYIVTPPPWPIFRPPLTYDGSRLNALRHGITSKASLLPWEDADDFAALLYELQREHQPSGPTEGHLVEELATVIWRKGRLRRAESVTFLDRLRRDTAGWKVTGVAGRQASLAAPLLLAADASNIDVASLRARLRMDEAAAEAELARVEERLDRVLGARRYLDGARATWTGAERRLDEETRRAWYREKCSDDDDLDRELLHDWLDRVPLPQLRARRDLLRHRDLVRGYLFAGAYDPDGLERLARHDVALDRKFERTLSMLVKLQTIRAERD